MIGHLNSEIIIFENTSRISASRSLSLLNVIAQALGDDTISECHGITRPSLRWKSSGYLCEASHVSINAIGWTGVFQQSRRPGPDTTVRILVFNQLVGHSRSYTDIIPEIL